MHNALKIRQHHDIIFMENRKKAIRRTERYEHVMTIQECYAQMGADYNEVFRRLYNEAMIRKFVQQKKRR